MTRTLALCFIYSFLAYSDGVQFRNGKCGLDLFSDWKLNEKNSAFHDSSDHFSNADGSEEEATSDFRDILTPGDFKLGEEKFLLDQPIVYAVSAAHPIDASLILIPNQNIGHLQPPPPLTMRLFTHTKVFTENSQRIEYDRTNIVPFSRFLVCSYRNRVHHGEEMTPPAYNASISAALENGKLKVTSFAISASLLQPTPKVFESIAAVKSATLRRNEKVIEIVGRYFEEGATVPSLKIRMRSLPPVGQLVSVRQVFAPKGAQISPFFVLPPWYRKQDGTETVRKSDCVTVVLAVQSLDSFPVDPFSKTAEKSHVPIENVTKDYEDVLLAVNLLMESRIEHVQSAHDEAMGKNDSNSAYEFRIDQMRLRALKKVLTDTTQQAKILRQLLGLESAQLLTGYTGELVQGLNEEQELATRTFVSGTPAEILQGPPGTGKSFVVAASVSALLRINRANDCILLTAPLRAQATLLMESIRRNSPDFGPFDILFLDTEERANTSSRAGDIDPWEKFTVRELLQSSPADFSPEEEAFRESFLESASPPSTDSERDMEHKALSLLLAKHRPKVIFASIPEVEASAESLTDLVTHVLCDEVGMLPDSQTLAIVSALSRIQQLFLIGDFRQLSPDFSHIPPIVIPYGFDSTIIRRDTLPTVFLRKTYRQHPIITACLSAAAYEGKLVSGIKPEKRAVLTQSSVPLPVLNVPLILVQVWADDPRRSQASVPNRDQNKAAVEMGINLSKQLPSASICILVFHTNTKDEIALELQGSGVQVFTVDEFQGRGADVIILVTTVSRSSHLTEDENEYYGNERRIVVALSRAKSGIVLIADFPFMVRHPMWRRFVGKALDYTPIVSERYIEVLTSQQNGFPRGEDGVLLDNKGVSVATRDPDVLSSNEYIKHEGLIIKKLQSISNKSLRNLYADFAFRRRD